MRPEMEPMRAPRTYPAEPTPPSRESAPLPLDPADDPDADARYHWLPDGQDLLSVQTALRTDSNSLRQRRQHRRWRRWGHQIGR
jgi:hypothetical protein